MFATRLKNSNVYRNLEIQSRRFEFNSDSFELQKIMFPANVYYFQ